MDTATTPIPSRPNARSKYPRRHSKAVKNGGKLKLQTLATLDGRTLASRRAHALIEAIENDLGGGGRLSEGARQLVQRAAVLGTFIENCEVRWLAGEQVELGDYLASVNAQRRVLATIGIERRPREVESLAEYLQRKHPPPIEDDLEAEAP